MHTDSIQKGKNFSVLTKQLDPVHSELAAPTSHTTSNKSFGFLLIWWILVIINQDNYNFLKTLFCTRCSLVSAPWSPQPQRKGTQAFVSINAVYTTRT